VTRRRFIIALLASGAFPPLTGAADATRARGATAKPNVIVFLSDNGGPTQFTTSLNTPLRGLKAQTSEGGTRIPFCMQMTEVGRASRFRKALAPGKLCDVK
jgi:hypothetical protein